VRPSTLCRHRETALETVTRSGLMGFEVEIQPLCEGQSSRRSSAPSLCLGPPPTRNTSAPPLCPASDAEQEVLCAVPVPRVSCRPGDPRRCPCTPRPPPRILLHACHSPPQAYNALMRGWKDARLGRRRRWGKWCGGRCSAGGEARWIRRRRHWGTRASGARALLPTVGSEERWPYTRAWSPSAHNVTESMN
jgi:hypothetical protein